jgi:hypothetical protein
VARVTTVRGVTFSPSAVGQRPQVVRRLHLASLPLQRTGATDLLLVATAREVSDANSRPSQLCHQGGKVPVTTRSTLPLWHSKRSINACDRRTLSFHARVRAACATGQGAAAVGTGVWRGPAGNPTLRGRQRSDTTGSELDVGLSRRSRTLIISALTQALAILIQ